MQWSDISFNPPLRTLRQFAAIWLVFFLILGCVEIFLRHHERLGTAWIVLGVVVGPPGIISPRLIRPVYVGATVATFPIGWVVSRIILACLFFLIFTPVALIFRLIGRDALRRKQPQGVESYWIEKTLPDDAGSYLRPF